MGVELHVGNKTLQTELLTLLVTDFVKTVRIEDVRGMISLLTTLTDKYSMFTNYQEGIDHSGLYDTVFGDWMEEQTETIVKTSKDYSKNQYRKIKRTLTKSEKLYLGALEVVNNRGVIEGVEAYQDTVLLFELVAEFIVSYGKFRTIFEEKVSDRKTFDKIVVFIIIFIILSNLGKKETIPLDTYVIAILSNLQHTSYEVAYAVKKGVRV